MIYLVALCLNLLFIQKYLFLIVFAHFCSFFCHFCLFFGKKRRFLIIIKFLFMRIKEIQSLIKFVAKSGASEVSLEMKDVKITIKTSNDRPPVVIHNPVSQSTPVSEINVVSQPVSSQPVDSIVTSPATLPADESSIITVKSPIIGTFYRKPAPDKPPFVEVGDIVSEGSVLCVIEAMKLFNEIESEVTGKIVKILVDDSSPVEFDQPLFLVDQS